MVGVITIAAGASASNSIIDDSNKSEMINMLSTIIDSVIIDHISNLDNGSVSDQMNLDGINSAIEARLQMQSGDSDTYDPETEKSVLRTDFEISANGSGELYNLDRDTQDTWEYVGNGTYDYEGIDKATVNHLNRMHQDMREQMIGPIFEKEENLNFSSDEAKSEYDQTLNGMQQAFINLKDTTSEQEWSDNFSIKEIDNGLFAPKIIEISGELDNTSFTRQYLPDENGKYNGYGSMQVTSNDMTQRFDIDENLNVTFDQQGGDPTLDSKQVYTPGQGPLTL